MEVFGVRRRSFPLQHAVGAVSKVSWTLGTPLSSFVVPYGYSHRTSTFAYVGTLGLAPSDSVEPVSPPHLPDCKPASRASNSLARRDKALPASPGDVDDVRGPSGSGTRGAFQVMPPLLQLCSLLVARSSLAFGSLPTPAQHGDSTCHWHIPLRVQAILSQSYTARRSAHWPVRLLYSARLPVLERLWRETGSILYEYTSACQLTRVVTMGLIDSHRPNCPGGLAKGLAARLAIPAVLLHDASLSSGLACQRDTAESQILATIVPFKLDDSPETQLQRAGAQDVLVLAEATTL